MDKYAVVEKARERYLEACKLRDEDVWCDELEQELEFNKAIMDTFVQGEFYVKTGTAEQDEMGELNVSLVYSYAEALDELDTSNCDIREIYEVSTGHVWNWNKEEE